MMHLRPATLADVPFVRDLESRVMHDHALKLWGRLIPPPHPSAFDLANTRIITLSDETAGFVMVEATPDHLRLRKLYLDPLWEGQGHGAAVLALVQAEATTRALPLRLSVLRPNRRALAFYLREGLAVTEETDERIFLTNPPPEYRADTVL
ncbi:N-acetyltransferase [Pseudotabrizicola sp.]|uniref:GNAT family N-acetyltransferase n=1 Tax=Pseudotabrizicola sp. TaxID=2939647 RepID=UPI0027159926|nr:GNAT family N-acetyltransferase [Pseudotabrizicola sp.]MDO8881338.1 GNAT family N-acetyltransferase [Pseudotabrizicola sp.]